MNLVIGIFLGVTYACLLLYMGLSGNWGALPTLAASVALFAWAFVIWNRDRSKTFPLKRWRHGFWHLLTAAASALVFYAIHLTP